MDESALNSLPRTSDSSPDQLFHSDPLYGASHPASCARIPPTRLDGSFLSGAVTRGEVSVYMNRGSGSGGAAPPHSECRMVEVHGVKVASFTVNGVELICLPQVFELFLKHLVGGLHTVYTKLKRLHISPVVCTVEQVRVLRGLGAIQPGVNRCKLITRADFSALYRDCTNASSRPGRPPKRTLGVATLTDSSRLLPHSVLSPALLSPSGLMVEAMKLQKIRMMMGFHGNRDLHHNGPESENDETGGSEASWDREQHLLGPSSSVVAPPAALSHMIKQPMSLLANRLADFPFMVMPHSFFPVGLPPAGVAVAMNQMSQLSGLTNMAAVMQREDEKDLQSDCPSPHQLELHHPDSTSHSPSKMSSPPSSSSSPAHTLDHDGADQENIKKAEKDVQRFCQLLKPAGGRLPITSLLSSANRPTSTMDPSLLSEGLSSMETLLNNVQGLLQVAVETVRSQDKSSKQERKELKVELERARDAREALQRRLTTEIHTRGDEISRMEEARLTFDPNLQCQHSGGSRKLNELRGGCRRRWTWGRKIASERSNTFTSCQMEQHQTASWRTSDRRAPPLQRNERSPTSTSSDVLSSSTIEQSKP
ncbi:dachshund homolog 2-like isoform X1 [Synchiropus splendidus]|uniref:dachshund homolog 2-like isoform X1 n=1 Tax=Synchiropus splendidus TaxID=270530 RepID=UPI00237E43BA|nr:dachshund homolog 2-like isoform X1 [Synchiropus splendidus]